MASVADPASSLTGSKDDLRATQRTRYGNSLSAEIDEFLRQHEAAEVSKSSLCGLTTTAIAKERLPSAQEVAFQAMLSALGTRVDRIEQLEIVNAANDLVDSIGFGDADHARLELFKLRSC